MRKLFLLFLFSLFSFFVFSQIPVGYYDTAIGKKKAALKTALHQIIKSANVLNYGGGDGKTWSGFAITDVRPTDGMVWDMYSNLNYAFNGNLAVTGMNIEHSFPKSWWGGTETQAYKDLHHLNPSDATANQRKSSYMMSVIDSAITYTNGVIKVGKTKQKSGMTLSAWEPADEYKGDFARVFMYMVTAYEDYAHLWTEYSENQLDNNTYPVFEPWAVNLLLQWSRQDPVSSKEINRNIAVYSIQGNRNPFIDFPQMAEYIWGNKTTVPFTLNGQVDYPYLSFPDQNDSIITDNTYLNYDIDFVLPLKAVNLNGNLNLTLNGTNANNFSLISSSISKTNAESGINIQIHFTAITTGYNFADLIISGGGIQPITVHLKTFVSNDFVALPATAINSNGFTANWTALNGANDYLLHVFSLIPTGSFQADTILKQDFSLTLPSGWLREGYTELGSGTIRLASSSTMGKVSFPIDENSTSKFRLNVIAKQYGSDNGAKLTAMVNNVSVANWTTGTNNQQFSVDFQTTTNPFTLSLSAIAGKRVYVDFLSIQKLTPIMTRVYVNGYPKSVGNTLTYYVDGLMLDSTYYYSLSSTSTPGIETNTSKVHTDISTKNLNQKGNNINIYQIKNGIRLENLAINSEITVFNVNGKQISHLKAFSTSYNIPVHQKGIYFVRISNQSKSTTYKVQIY